MIRPRGRRPALVGVAALSIVASVWSGLPAAQADPDQVEGIESLRWVADRAPFRLTFLSGGRSLVGQASGEAAGPGGRMAYALADGSTHRLTDLIDRREATLDEFPLYLRLDGDAMNDQGREVKGTGWVSRPRRG